MKEYDLSTRHQIPKDYECCWNCRYMRWMVGVGMGVRCSNEKNKDTIFVESTLKVKGPPLIPGVGQKCEHFENKRLK